MDPKIKYSPMFIFCLRYSIRFVSLIVCTYYLFFLFVFPPEVILPLQSYWSLSCDHGLHCGHELLWEQQKGFIFTHPPDDKTTTTTTYLVLVDYSSGNSPWSQDLPQQFWTAVAEWSKPGGEKRYQYSNTGTLWRFLGYQLDYRPS